MSAYVSRSSTSYLMMVALGAIPKDIATFKQLCVDVKVDPAKVAFAPGEYGEVGVTIADFDVACQFVAQPKVLLKPAGKAAVPVTILPAVAPIFVTNVPWFAKHADIVASVNSHLGGSARASAPRGIRLGSDGVVVGGGAGAGAGASVSPAVGVPVGGFPEGSYVTHVEMLVGEAMAAAVFVRHDAYRQHLFEAGSIVVRACFSERASGAHWRMSRWCSLAPLSQPLTRSWSPLRPPAHAAPVHARGPRRRRVRRASGRQARCGWLRRQERRQGIACCWGRRRLHRQPGHRHY